MDSIEQLRLLEDARNLIKKAAWAGTGAHIYDLEINKLLDKSRDEVLRVIGREKVSSHGR